MLVDRIITNSPFTRYTKIYTGVVLTASASYLSTRCMRTGVYVNTREQKNQHGPFTQLNNSPSCSMHTKTRNIYTRIHFVNTPNAELPPTSIPSRLSIHACKFSLVRLSLYKRRAPKRHSRGGDRVWRREKIPLEIGRIGASFFLSTTPVTEATFKLCKYRRH